MKLIVILLMTVLCASFSSSKPETCKSVTQEDCENMTSEYEKYRACMERRTKRSLDCYEDDNCSSCDCDECSYGGGCDSCSKQKCCSQCCQKSSCATYNCCHQTCRAECRSNTCRTACKKKCQDRPSSPVISETRMGANHNITTVIHLNNVINNTNLINLPISVNNTVLNNITNSGQYGGGGSGLTYIEKGGSQQSCCTTIGPRQCAPINQYPFMKCFHVRRKACGAMCTAPVVHYQTHEICDNEVNVQQPCQKQIVYIPQPQPRCAYKNTWPYVTCGNQEMQSCEGCYDHYVKREDVSRCSSFCYDDGYGVGPYYRQGPYYRPGYAHAPSCLQTGQCDIFGDFSTGYDFANEGFAENGFPPGYPPNSYPYPIIDDCKNCTFGSDLGSQEFTNQFGYKDLDSRTPISSPNRLINIDANVDPPRSERYAEIRIKSKDVKASRKSKAAVVVTTTASVSTSGTTTAKSS